jgi:hypothetical protein
MTTVGSGPELERPVTGSVNGSGGAHSEPRIVAPYRFWKLIGVRVP